MRFFNELVFADGTTVYSETVVLLICGALAIILLTILSGILALTKGGPGTSTYSATLQIYNDAFTKNMYGLGSAEAMLYFFAVLLITQIVLRVMSRKEVEL